MKTLLAAIPLAAAAALLLAGCSGDGPASQSSPSADAALADPIDSTDPVDRHPVYENLQAAAEVFQDAAGMGIVAGGCGLASGDGSFTVDVPVTRTADVLRAAFYWTVRTDSPAVDETVLINGREYTGSRLASFTTNHGEMRAHVYKVGGRTRGPVVAGTNVFDVSGLDKPSGGRVDGIGVVVTYRDPAGFRTIVTQAMPEYFHGPQEVDGAVHTFSFPAVTAGTRADFFAFVGDGVDEHADGILWTFHQGPAPARLIGGGYSVRNNVLTSAQGGQWDIVRLDGLEPPAGADGFSFQFRSPDSPRGDSAILAVAAICLDRAPE